MPQQLYPFAKSRYFPNKRMRSADFIRDQNYLEHKLAFLSRWNFGSGTALGLEVQRIDTDSLLVSPGLAVDRDGRWLIVDEPAICRLRTLRGFEALCGETALLWLAYQEELTDAMFVPGDREEVREYAAAKECFSFYLTNMQPLPPPMGNSVLFSDVTLFEDDDLRVRQVIPKVLPAQGKVQLRIAIESFCTEPLELHLHYAPELPGLTGALSLDQPLMLQKGETALTLIGTLSTSAQAILISLPKRGFVLEKRGVQFQAQTTFQEEFPVTANNPLTVLEKRLLSEDPSELWESGPEDGIPIAGLRLLRYEDQILLEDVFPLSRDSHAILPCFRERLRNCREFFPDDSGTACPAAEPAGPVPSDIPTPGRRLITTGTVTLNAGLHLQEESVLCSGEIAHELGPGTVYVAFGLENKYPVPGLERNYTELLLGDASLFPPLNGACDLRFDRGVRVHPEKGTFELAIRLRSELRQASLCLRWFAWRTDEHPVNGPKAVALLRLEPDVAHAAPGEIINFVPVFQQGSGAPCDFLIPDRQNGRITPNGIYTAPKKAGLYQVCAQIKDMPETRINAFVIVRAGTEEAAHASDAL